MHVSMLSTILLALHMTAGTVNALPTACHSITLDDNNTPSPLAARSLMGPSGDQGSQVSKFCLGISREFIGKMNLRQLVQLEQELTDILIGNNSDQLMSNRIPARRYAEMMESLEDARKVLHGSNGPMPFELADRLYVALDTFRAVIMFTPDIRAAGSIWAFKNYFRAMKEQNYS
ncbi:MAG: hypothetical protein M1829_001877 [Trizodia sp. TS-e1964]|nr:MAG: hypothetical protein M1829_001877 [Trizodia sp. TS-e1964]